MKIIAPALIAALAAACTSWRVQGISPEMVLEREHPKAVRVTRADGSSLVVAAPTVVADTLRGEDYYRDGRPVAIPLSEVHTIAVERADGAKAAGILLGLGVGALVGLGMAIAATF